MNDTRAETPPKVKRPWWVRFALLGLPNRRAALASMWLLLWIAGLAVVYGFRDIRYSAGGAIIIPALWYLQAIRWVDEHGGWPAKG